MTKEQYENALTCNKYKSRLESVKEDINRSLLVLYHTSGDNGTRDIIYDINSRMNDNILQCISNAYKEVDKEIENL